MISCADVWQPFQPVTVTERGWFPGVSNVTESKVVPLENIGSGVKVQT